jgi:hypothetical protein
LPFYAAVILLWNYPIGSRFLLVFLPFFIAGLWTEARHLFSLIHLAIRGPRAASDKVFGVLFGVGAAALLCALAVNYVGGTRRTIVENARNRSALLREKVEAYRWLACCTPREAKVIAYEDAALYLYSGRQSLRPIVFTTAGLYDPQYVAETLDRLSDVSRGIGARYWLVSEDDFAMEWKTAATEGRAREIEMARKFPIVFTSRDGRIQIYDLGGDVPASRMVSGVASSDRLAAQTH